MSNEVKFLQEFYRGKKVLVTGAQGFKGSWLLLFLKELGAEVVGCGLHAADGLFFNLLDTDELGIKTYSVDIRNRSKFVSIIKIAKPDIIFHLAAQPIVSVGYDDPYLTYSTNVMGTVNLLDGVKAIDKKISVVNVTTDKVYQNIEKEDGYEENEKLMGEDPYSSSKSCSELVTFSYNKSFFEKTLSGDTPKVVSTCRAGNVIGGGDFAFNRIIPDLVRGVKNNSSVVIRNFDGVRPYEHVLDALYAYVLLAAKQYEDHSFSGAYNIGPNEESLMRTRELTEFFQNNTNVNIVDGSGGRTFHEANLLSLDSSKFRKTFDWEPKWKSKEKMLLKTLDWYNKWFEDNDMTEISINQIKEFLNE